VETGASIIEITMFGKKLSVWNEEERGVKT
jgi:hypothetical protein